ncbi:ZN236 protein, partial [Polypterus senegalus]
MPQLSKPMVLAEGLSLIYKVCESGIEITGTNANVQRATREIQKEISKRSAHSQSKNSGIKTSVEPFKNFKVVVCSGYDNTIHLSSESLIVQNSGHEILFDGKDPGVVAGELSEITLTVKEGLSKLGKLQSVIRLHWQCKSIKNNHTEVLEAAVIKALEYVKTQGQTSVSIYCPLDKDLNTSIQAATVAAALEGFCKAQSYLFVSALSVFIVCPNETEWANIMKKNLEIVWACSNSKQNGMQEVIPVIPQNISVRLVSGTLEENQVQAIVVPVTVSARTNSIKLSSLCTHKPSCNLEELLQIQSSCLVDKLLKGQIIPVTCRGSGLLCEYLYLMEVQDDWRDPVELEVNIYTNSKVEIILTGPRSEVHKAQEILKRDLNSVVVKSMKIEGLGAAHYFQDPKTTEILKAVGSAYFCIITKDTILNAGFGQMNDILQMTPCFQNSAVLWNARADLPFYPVTEYSLPIPSSLQSSFLCRYPDCCRSFDTSNGLQSHYRQMHTPEGRAKCSKCGKESTKSGITQHEKTCMGNSFSYIPKATPSPNIQSMQHDSGLGTVSDGLSFITPNISTPVTPVDNLGFDLKPKSLFYNSAFHSDAVTEYTLPISSSLQSSFLCQYPDCCRSFDTSNGLQSHYRQMHTPEESAKCSKCGKESTKSGITQHEKTCMGNSFSSIPKATPSPILQSMQLRNHAGLEQRDTASAESAASSTVQEGTFELSELKVLLADLRQDIKKSEKANEKATAKAHERLKQEMKQANECLRQEIQQANERLRQEVQRELRQVLGKIEERIEKNSLN